MAAASVVPARTHTSHALGEFYSGLLLSSRSTPVYPIPTDKDAYITSLYDTTEIAGDAKNAPSVIESPSAGTACGLHAKTTPSPCTGLEGTVISN